MTKQEINQAANECADSFGSMEPCIEKIKQDVAIRAFVIGATMVNDRQPYTKDDIKNAFRAGQISGANAARGVKYKIHHKYIGIIEKGGANDQE